MGRLQCGHIVLYKGPGANRSGNRGAFKVKQTRALLIILTSVFIKIIIDAN